MVCHFQDLAKSAISPLFQLIVFSISRSPRRLFDSRCNYPLFSTNVHSLSSRDLVWLSLAARETDFTSKMPADRSKEIKSKARKARNSKARKRKRAARAMTLYKGGVIQKNINQGNKNYGITNKEDEQFSFILTRRLVVQLIKACSTPIMDFLVLVCDRAWPGSVHYQDFLRFVFPTFSAKRLIRSIGKWKKEGFLRVFRGPQMIIKMSLSLGRSSEKPLTLLISHD